MVHKLTSTALTLCEVEVEGRIYPEVIINVTGKNLPEGVDLAAVNDDDISSCVSLGQHTWLSDGVIQVGRAVLSFQNARLRIYASDISFQWQR